MKKYPRTYHIEGSRLQEGDEDLTAIPFEDLKGAKLTIEEKIDGSNSGISFDEEGDLKLQSRGHYLEGGDWAHFNLFKTWANGHLDELFDILEDRYLMFGEWTLAKHTVYYDVLPHYFLEFDIYDKKEDIYLSTKARNNLLDGSSIRSVPVLHEGKVESLEVLKKMIRHSWYKTSDWKKHLKKQAEKRGLDFELVCLQTDMSDLSEGLYVKVENDKQVLERYKFVRHGFLQTVIESNSHWIKRPVIPNLLRPDADIFK